MLFAKILFTTILSEISGLWLLRDKQFGFRPKHSTALLLTHLAERESRDFDKKRLTVAAFLNVVKTFDCVWVDGLLYKLPALNFPSCLVKMFFSYVYDRMFKASFHSATSCRQRHA
jgi:Reverse transcriptase (RNA-dependent DNA polymerase).